jgi:hypothetical protein
MPIPRATTATTVRAIAALAAVSLAAVSLAACAGASTSNSASGSASGSPSGSTQPASPAQGAAPGAGATESATGVVLFDGVYAAASIDTHGAAIGWDYVRFFDDGAVITVSAPGQAESAWLRADDTHSAKGRYAIQGSAISFSATSGFGVVDYRGTIGKDKIALRWRSRINGLEGGGVYAYLALPSEAPAPPKEAAGAEVPAAAAAPPDEALKPSRGGWYCTHPSARASGPSRCSPTARECQTHRRAVATGRGRPRMSECAEQKTASCQTVKDGTGNTARACYERVEECTRAGDELRASKPPREASDCAAW